MLLSIPLVMTTFWYFGRSGFYQQYLEPLVPPDLPLRHLYPFFYFALSSVVLRLLLPLALIRLVLRRSPGDYGFRLPRRFEYTWAYGLLWLAVIPFIAHAAGMPSFQQRYPFCGEAILRDGAVPVLDFLIYQAFYGLVFVSGEGYWRGFVVFGLRRHIGDLGILVMVTPYVMSHYGKPAAESYAAILTGLVLGFLALRHGSFWLGVAVHWAAALAMDLLAIRQHGWPFAW
ncbi:MAG TPA: hypothetical protein PLQ97_00015 [Myxococcota bacterium]|nr:hypothetical protein [Myxococcota bacterium]HQK49558.1 hypothetical protein [Myxococcota bacterium]